MTSMFLLLFIQSSWADFGMNTLSAKFNQTQSEVVLNNMPRIRSQDSIGLCFAFAAATLYDEANCRARGTANCGTAPDSEKSAPLDLARFSQDLPPETDWSDRFNYEGLREGGSAAFTLQNAIASGAVVKESCAPFDGVLSKINDPAQAQKIEMSMWQKFKDSYDTYQSKAKSCPNCSKEYASAVSKELKENFNIKTPQVEVLQAFAEKTYEKFLDRLLISDECWDLKNQISLKGRWQVNVFPQVGEKKVNYEQTIKKIKELLANKTPLAVSFCTQTPLKARTMKSCANTGHEVVVVGYRRVCDSKQQCRDVVKIQNSWGESWQKANNEGWIDAQELIKRTFYEPQALTWLEQKKN